MKIAFTFPIPIILALTLNEVRNKAAKSGGNAIKIIEASSSGDPYHGGGITYIVGVYNCDFEKINN